MVFFLHLLGLDMNGHAHRPKSRQYFENIASVDEGVARLERLFAAFYNDSDTAYVFTADHGMSNKGSHGDGEPECTRTPLVVWGAGVRTSPPIDAGSEAFAAGHGGSQGDDGSPAEWGELRRVERKDIEQAQLAPLIAALIGQPPPRNNIGLLPLEYVDVGGDEARRARLLVANVRQVCWLHPVPLRS